MSASIKTIICPVDFSEGSESALGQAVELARVLGAQLELLHVFQIPALALPDAPITMSPTFVTDLTNRAQKMLEDAALRVRAKAENVAVTTHLMQSAPAEGIVNRAREVGATMIVISTHGRSGFKRFLLGSVAERVVRMASVPVLTVQLTAASDDAPSRR